MHFRSTAVRVLVLVVLFVNTPDGRSQTASPAKTDATAPKWKGEALVPPLPSDARAREDALAEARRLAADRTVQRPVSFRPVVQSIEAGALVVPRAIAALPRGVSAAAVLTPRQRETAAWLESTHAPREASDAPTNAPISTVPDDGTLLVLPEPAAPTTTGFIQMVGIDDNSIAPMSPDIAAGPQDLVATAGNGFIIKDKCGNSGGEGSFQAAFALPGNYYYSQPRVVYDEWDNRWIMLVHAVDTPGSQARLYMLVSSSPDPGQGWLSFEIAFALAGNYALNAALAVSPDAIYITADEFDFSPFTSLGSTMMEANKVDVYDFNGFTPYYRRGLTHPIDASLATYVTPAQMHSYPGEVYFVASRTGGGSNFTLWTLTGLPGFSVLSSANVAVPGYTAPPNFQQPNLSYLASGGSQVRDCVLDGEYVFAGYGRTFSGNPTIAVRRINVNTLATTEVFVGGTPKYAFLGLDIDENGEQTWCYTACSTGLFPTASWATVHYEPASIFASGTLGAGLANYTLGGAGTSLDPYAWGARYAVARDPSDHRTMWLHGANASNDPTPSWQTFIEGLSTFAASNLVVTALSPPSYAGGPEGGPFSTDVFQFELTNYGSTTAQWNVSGMPAWLAADDADGSLEPGAMEVIGFHLTPPAYALTWGSYVAQLQFENCTGGGDVTKDVTLAVGLDGSCLGAKLGLAPSGPPSAPGLPTQDVGVFVTAIEDVTVCSVGFTADLQTLPQTAYARIYAANGNTRGALLTEGVLDLVMPGPTTHYIPLEYTLQACQEYEIAFLFTGSVSFDGWTDTPIALPYDVGRVIRVRKGSRLGIGNGVLKPIEIIAAQSASQATTTFYPGGSLTVDYGPNFDLGAYVKPTHTVRLCSLGLKMLTPPGSDVRAKVYAAVGGTRSSLLAEGHTLSTTPVLGFVDVPIDVLVVGGGEYDFAVEVDGTAFGEFNISGVTPFTQDGLFEVQQGEFGGVGNSVLPTLRVAWSADQPGTSFNLGMPNGPFPPPFQINGDLFHGAWVTSLIDQEMYSLGAYINVPAGVFVYATVWPASGTTITGGALSTGRVVSDASGARWHDVPLSVSLDASGEYLFQITASPANGAPVWHDTPGVPYDVYGTMRIRDAALGGDPSNDLLSLRMCACNPILTPVADRPPPVPIFLEPAAPNPAGRVVTFRYGVDEEGPVSLEIFDVAGRRVAQVRRESAARVGRTSAEFDTSAFASGIYFARLTTATRSVSRKFVVAH